MTDAEVTYYNQLVAEELSDSEIFTTIFEYKTQQLSTMIEQLIKEQNDFAENYFGFE